jgi:hypothetical protein
MGYARNFQPPSFFNPFSGYYGANTGMGGFQSQFGGFQQPQYGGFQQPQYGGFQQPQFGGLGGFQQPFGGGYGGGFQQPQYGGGFSQPSFINPFGRGFNPRTMPPQMQPMPQPMPQPISVNDDLYSTIGTQYRGNAMPTTGGGGMGGFGGFDPMMGMQGELVPRAVQPTTEMERQMERRPYHTGAFGPNFGGGGGGGYGGGFNPMMGGLGGFAYGMPNREPVYGDSRMGRGLRQADMRMPQPQVQDFVPTEYSVIADLARANGISTPMMTLEESTQGTGNYTGRATDYYKQQLGAKNIDFGESALAPYRQKIIENYRNTRMHNA